jgi:hypothetical protein
MLGDLPAVISIFLSTLQPLDRFSIVVFLALNNNLRNEWVKSQPTERPWREHKLYIPFSRGR